MNIDETLKLFDSCWFGMEIIKKQKDSPDSSVFESNSDQENHQQNSSKAENLIETQAMIDSNPPPLIRSISDDLSSRTSFSSTSLSPDTVLFSPKLKTIPSSKEMAETEQETEPKRRFQARNVRNRVKTKTRFSKSLSELEFEELKGFAELGFVFSEQDEDPRLVDLIPGLQRLRRRNDGDEEQGNGINESAIPRPYLSEAWDVLERQREKEKNRFVDWRIFMNSDSRNEMNMKNNLRLWAHNVASSVR